jgi:ubiquinone biosynthesis protein UbiJ
MAKKNPNDTTFRNINALKARVAKLEARVKKLERRK